MWSLYKELARPEGSGFRWEKIFSRYIIFHKHHKFIDKSKLKCFPENSPTVDKFADFIKEQKWPLIGQRAVSLYLNMDCKPLENMYAFARAGASIIITYHFKEILEKGWMN
jgi:hypothetical protein